ncbi:beta-1,6-N-acetylglucosaminyltransferase [Dyadobacter frigoris]|uniref:Peptide O-xylosyltransferase n=1 Tax=Dyadobacter frigoris TaxID=2576211 RepID=A0A4U6D1U6_9BACT|nr:beta-1,6-N-acetylglucosaminyltransferase [Dyadobacter frigoris]TKT90225.1 glycosyl transferase [Dyadobacter frigoris]GLU52460.1 glycosyl transferase [Dyadobacter frigoris]
MKIAHLILAHAEPQQLERLIERLRHQDAFFFIHIDKKTNLESFRTILNYDNVFLVRKRVVVNWGAYSIVQATINGLEEIIEADIDINYVNLLSGSDYPIKNANSIHDFFQAHNGDNFMEYFSVFEEWQEAIPRLTEYHLTNFSIPGRYLFQKWLNKLTPVRQLPYGLIAVGRSQWFSITKHAADYILKYLKSNSKVIRFFKLTWAPDEIFFQTILYNSVFRDQLVNNNLRYIDWSAHKASPKVLTIEDKDALMTSSALFARKFDMDKQPDILDYLDHAVHDLI